MFPFQSERKGSTTQKEREGDTPNLKQSKGSLWNSDVATHMDMACNYNLGCAECMKYFMYLHLQQFKATCWQIFQSHRTHG